MVISDKAPLGRIFILAGKVKLCDGLASLIALAEGKIQVLPVIRLYVEMLLISKETFG